jgi:hypothetical protein
MANGASRGQGDDSALPAFGMPPQCWRQHRRLELAETADSSMRYLSTLETGRATPGRDIVPRLADFLGVPLRERQDAIGERIFLHARAQPRGQLQQFLDGHDGRVRGKYIGHPLRMAKMPRAAGRFIATSERLGPATIDRGVYPFLECSRSGAVASGASDLSSFRAPAAARGQHHGEPGARQNQRRRFRHAAGGAIVADRLHHRELW